MALLRLGDKPGEHGLSRIGPGTVVGMAEVSARQASLAAWARVTILLNIGDVPAATQAAGEASAITHWYRVFGDYQVGDRVQIFDTPQIPSGWMWMEPGRRRVLLSRAVVARFGLSDVMFRFASACLRLEGPAFRFYDRDNWLAEDNANRIRLGMDPTDR